MRNKSATRTQSTPHFGVRNKLYRDTKTGRIVFNEDGTVHKNFNSARRAKHYMRTGQ